MAGKRTASHPPIEAVKAAHSRRLMTLEGVVGVGIEEDEGGEPFISVMVERADAPGVKRLPRKLAGYRLQVAVVGAVRARLR